MRPLRRPAALLPALVMLLHALCWWGAGPFDDDFICYRYASHWISGRGLVFNPGQWVEGYSNPLWVFLVGAALRLGIEPTLFSRVVGILAAAVAVWAVDDTWRVRGGRGLFSPGLLVAFLPPMAWHAVAGLGTTLLAALLALWLRSWSRARRQERAPLAAAIWLALACLLRQESALFLLVFALGERRRLPSLLPLLALVGWTAYRWRVYGDLLPNGWYVKKLPWPVDWAYGLRYLGVATLTSGMGLLALLAPAAPRPLRAAGIGVLLHTLYVVHVGGDFMALARFHVPVLPIAVLCAAGGLERLAPRLALPAGVLLGIGVQWVQVPWSDTLAQRHPLVVQEARRFRFLDHQAFEERWARVGRALGDACEPGTSLATSPVGAIGWYSRLRVIDLLGLTGPHIRDVAPDLEGVSVKGHHRFDARWVLQQRPDLILLGNAVLVGGRIEINPWERSLYRHPDFQRDYLPIELPIAGDEPLRLWIRRGAALPRGARRLE